MRGPARSSGAFSLIELLVVICVIALLMTLTVPALVSIAQGQGTKRAVNDISGILESARAEAMATSTWVWVGFSDTTTENTVKNSEITVLTVSSRDGSSDLIASNLQQQGRPVRFEHVVLMPGLTGRQSSGAVPFDDSDYRFTFTVGTSTRSYSAIAFSPRGDAHLKAGAVPSWIEVGLKEKRGGRENDSRMGSVQVSGISGQTIVQY